MNAENAEYQILLALQSSHYRSRELDSLRTGASAIVCTRSSKESRTLLAKAFYLILLAARFEKLLTGQCNQALQSLSRLVSLPDELQWEYRSAHSLGVACAVSRLGLLQDEIIGQARLALCDACALIMAQAPDLQLSIHDSVNNRRRLDHVQETLLGLEPRLGKKMVDTVAQAVAASKNALLSAREAAEDLTASSSQSPLYGLLPLVLPRQNSLPRWWLFALRPLLAVCFRMSRL